MFDRQKQRLQERFGFVFGEPLKTEACMVLRPSHPGDVSLGRDGAFLIGEAAGFISTSSFEGISFAMDSARLLAEVLTAAPADLHQAYRRGPRSLRREDAAQLLRKHFMYRPTLRHLVMRSGLQTIDVIDG